MQLTSINQGWQLVLNIGFGTGAVYILRWYWWRINAWSEISAMAVAAAMTIALSHISISGNNATVYAKTALITGFVTTIAWLIATFITEPESQQTLIAFYKRVHPTVYGWKHIARLVPELPEVRDVASNAFNWVMGCDSGLRMPVWHRKTGFPAVVLGSLPAVDCRGCRLSDLLGSFPPGVGHTFWDFGSDRTGGDARAYINSVNRYGFFGVRSQACFTRPRSRPAGEKLAICGPRGSRNFHFEYLRAEHLAHGSFIHREEAAIYPIPSVTAVGVVDADSDLHLRLAPEARAVGRSDHGVRTKVS